jgi:hypothetical protein
LASASLRHCSKVLPLNTPGGTRCSKNSSSAYSSASTSPLRALSRMRCTSSSTARLWAMNAPLVVYSWRTSAWTMNSVRAAVGSIGPYGTFRSLMIGRPYSVTCSRAITCACLSSQCGWP